MDVKRRPWRRLMQTLAVGTVVAVAPLVAPAGAATAQPATPALTAPAPRAVTGMAGQVEQTSVATDFSGSGAACGDYYFPVTMSEGDPTVYRVWGRLCSKTSFTDRAVQVLLHGGSYNHTYWDWPFQPENYSYVKAATEAGFVTLTLDRLGYGYSDRPNSLGITFPSNAWVAHQVVQYLRRGALGEPAKKVILGGHSMGGLTTNIEAGTYNDVDGVIVSGMTHVMNYPVIATIAAALVPAELDQKFAGNVPLASAYTTTRAGVRCQIAFYQQGAYDPDICAAEEKYKDTIAAGEWVTVVTHDPLPTPSDRITAPVLMAMGNNDHMMCVLTCDADLNSHLEASFYPNAASYELYTQPRSAHDQNLHYTARQWFQKAIDWSIEHVGVNT
ncbi:alpha/beta hydrolase [Prauserella flavalba]|nr:alpha/beta fold hydrolase [Prauserella flavalba]